MVRIIWFEISSSIITRFWFLVHIIMSITKLKNSVSSRVAAGAVGITMALTLLGTAGPVHAAALTSAQIQSIVSLLQSFGADAQTIANVQASLMGQPTTGGSTGGASVCPYTWTRDLMLGSAGDDVMKLQVFLNANGAMVAAAGAGSPGMETMAFGPLTQKAVAAFQAANAISPAVGYFGPLTRATVNSKCVAATPGTPGTPGTPTTPGTPVLEGGEGSISNINNLGDVDTSVDEGEKGIKVVGTDFEAKDADIKVERVDVDFHSHTGGGTTGSSRLTNYVKSVSLMLDGNVIGTIDASTVTKDSSDVYTFRFSGLNGVVKEGNKAKLYVLIDVEPNMDSNDDADTWGVRIPQNGIRAVDAAGISETYVASNTTVSQTVTFSTQSTGKLTISQGSGHPLATLHTVSSTTETKNIKLLEFKIKAEEQEVNIDDFAIQVSVSGAATAGTIVKRYHLQQGSTVLATETGTSTLNQVIFDNVNHKMAAGVTETFTVYADIADADSGEPDNNDSVTASTTGSLTGWKADDVSGNTLTEGTNITGSVSGNAQSFFTNQGIKVKFTSGSIVKTTGGLAGVPDQVDYTIKFSVENSGDATLYFDGDVTAAAVAAAANGLTWATTTDSTTGTTTGGGTYGYGTGILSPDATDSDDTTDTNDKRFVVEPGETRSFTFKVTIPAGGDNVAAGVRLTGFAWGTANVDAMANLYNFDLGSFKTDTVTGLSIQ